MWRLMDGDVEGPLNIGSPVEHTILQLAELVLRLTNSGSRIEHRALPADDPHRRCPDISRASHFGWEPRVELEEGLQHTIAYFREAGRAQRPPARRQCRACAPPGLVLGGPVRAMSPAGCPKGLAPQCAARR